MSFRLAPVVLTLFLSVSSFLSQSEAQTCACGPEFCTDTPGYKNALAAKKQRLSKEHPARLLALFDKVDRCQACIERSPDTFNLLRRAKNGTITIDAWTAENEKIGAVDLASGTLTACRVIITRHAFECCGSQPFNKRADYDEPLDLNTTATLACAK